MSFQNFEEFGAPKIFSKRGAFEELRVKNVILPNAIIFQEKASAEIRGEFYPTKSWVKFAGAFLVDFSGLFPWREHVEKIHGKK